MFYPHHQEAQLLHADLSVHVEKFVEFAHLEEEDRVKVPALKLPPLAVPLQHHKYLLYIFFSGISI